MVNRNYWRFAVVSIVFGGSLCQLGCASDQAARYYSGSRFDARSPEDVQIIWSKPNRPFEVIADFQARNTNAKYMQKQAAKIGADAVIVSKLGGYRSSSDQWAGEDKLAKSFSRITGTAIRYK